MRESRRFIMKSFAEFTHYANYDPNAVVENNLKFSSDFSLWINEFFRPVQYCERIEVSYNDCLGYTP